MKWKRTALIATLTLIARMACAQFTGFPLSEQTNTVSWDTLNETYRPVQQLVSAVVERCELLSMTNLNVVESFDFYYGETNAVITNGGFVYTNLCIAYTNITTTNCAPVTYTYTDPVRGSTNVTVYPPVTRYFFYYFDQKLDEMLDDFVPTNISGYASLENFMQSNRTWDTIGSLTNWSAAILPKTSKAGLFSDLGVGQATNFTWWDTLRTQANIERTNQWVSSGTADWTLRVVGTQNWNMGELHYAQTNQPYAATNSAAWTFIQQQNTDIAGKYNIYQTNVFPSIHYTWDTNTYPGGVSNDITITGFALDTNGAVGAASEEYLVTNSWTPVSNRWVYLTDMSASTNSQTNDVYALVWTNELILVPQSTMTSNDWTFSASMLDERWKVLKNLVWTYFSDDSDPVTNSFTNWTSLEYIGPLTDSVANANASLTSGWGSASNVTPNVEEYAGMAFGGGQYRGLAQVPRFQLYLTNITASSKAKDVDVYYCIQNPIGTYNRYDDMGNTWTTEGAVQIMTSITNSTNVTVTSDYIGSTSLPSPLNTNVPPAGNVHYLGYRFDINDPEPLQLVLKWNISGGLDWY